MMRAVEDIADKQSSTDALSALSVARCGTWRGPAAGSWFLFAASTALATTTPDFQCSPLPQNALARLVCTDSARPLAGPAAFNGEPLTLASGTLTFRLTEETVHDPAVCKPDHAGFLAPGYGLHPLDACQVVMATVTVSGKQVARAPATVLDADADLKRLRIKAEIIRLSPGTDQPQIFITGYTGGLHCCTAGAVATDDGGKWRFSFLDAREGEMWLLLNLTQGGPPVFVGAAPGFEYTWASFAGSYAPTLLQILRGDKLVDVTRQPAYRSFLLDRLHEMEESGANASERNGYLAAWVAQNALLGQFDSAWSKMRATYDKRVTTWRCAIDEDAWPTTPGVTPACPETQQIKVPFPEALALALFKLGYITKQQAAAVGFDPDAVTAKRKTDMEAATAAYRDAGR
jgi:hypothetical protein